MSSTALKAGLSLAAVFGTLLAVFGLLGAVLVWAFFYIVVPALIVILVFPALSITGWAAFWLGLAVTLVWWTLLAILQRR